MILISAVKAGLSSASIAGWMMVSCIELGQKSNPGKVQIFVTE
jgi:hypothetical protein